MPNICWYYHQRRGGFVTRPVFYGKEMLENRYAIVDRFLPWSQGGLETRPYHPNVHRGRFG